MANKSTDATEILGLRQYQKSQVSSVKLVELTLLAIEMLEVQIVNNIAPFLIVSQLLPLMRAQPREYKFVVNVSSVEGQFTGLKTQQHPHTNMAKAALNMLTCTCSLSLSSENIFMNR